MKLFLTMILAMVFCFLTIPSFASVNNENNPNLSVIEIGSPSATGDIYGLYIPSRAKILSVHIVDSAGIAADVANYAKFELKSGATVLSSYDSRAASQGALVANVPKDSVLTSDASLLPKGSYLKLSYTKTGSVSPTAAKAFINWSVQ